MSIHSTQTGHTKLTKEDATTFRRQATYGRTPKAALEALKEGEQLLKMVEQLGHCLVKVKSKTPR